MVLVELSQKNKTKQKDGDTHQKRDRNLGYINCKIQYSALLVAASQCGF